MSKNKLSAKDIESIRKVLPYDWRLQIIRDHPSITVRQITEAFSLRTQNPQWTDIVFTSVAASLRNQGHTRLARKCLARIRWCKSRQLKAA
jgi:hypothetical protein